MPCRDYESDSYSNFSNGQEAEKLKKDLDQRTRQLCITVDIIKEKDIKVFNKLPADVRKWYVKHKKSDLLNAKKEKLESELLKISKLLK